jgi:DNA-directed RNA polymerase subunit L
VELNILNKTNNELEVELRGETHTLLNLLKDLLIKDERVEAAFYDMKYVSISEPVLYIKTKRERTNKIKNLQNETNVSEYNTRQLIHK